jgi:hypothetical protein
MWHPPAKMVKIPTHIDEMRLIINLPLLYRASNWGSSEPGDPNPLLEATHQFPKR